MAARSHEVLQKEIIDALVGSFWICRRMVRRSISRNSSLRPVPVPSLPRGTCPKTPRLLFSKSDFDAHRGSVLAHRVRRYRPSKLLGLNSRWVARFLFCESHTESDSGGVSRRRRFRYSEYLPSTL